MKTLSIHQTVTFAVSPHAVYEALLDSKQHAAFTGREALINRKVGGRFSVFDGYAHGTNVKLVPDKLIVQDWRAKEPNWPADHFSRVTFRFTKTKTGTKLTFTQSGVPSAHAKSISDGWREYYWQPLKNSFIEHS